MMIEVSLSESQIELLLGILEHVHSGMLVEVRHTDTANFRIGLKERLAAVESLIQRLQAAKQQSGLAEHV